MKKIYLLSLVLSLFLIGIDLMVNAQGGVAINSSGAHPDSAAMLDVSSANKGFLIPRMSSAQRAGITGAPLSLMVYDTTINCLEIYGYGVWHSITCLCTTAPSTPDTIIGNTNPCSGATSVTYAVIAESTATSYTWTVPNGATILAGQGTNSILVNIGSTPGNVTVTANNDCGNSSPRVLPITINNVPGTPGAIIGDTTAVSGSSGNAFSINPVNNASTYTWIVPPDASITSGQGTTSINVTFGTTSGTVSVTAGNVCGSSSASSLSFCNYNHGAQTFVFAGIPQTFVVPCGPDSVTIQCWGASGGEGDQGGTAGLGGYATGTLPVYAGEVLNVYVGGSPSNVSDAGGWNGGGTGVNGNSNWSGGGGGASDVRLNDTSFNGRIIVAGGGGGGNGAGYGGGTNGCSYGSTVAQNSCNSSCTGNGSGGGGTQNAGGAAGPEQPGPWPQYEDNGNPGSFGVGGNGVWNSTANYVSAGGGGGWYGGGSGGTSGWWGGGSGGGGSGYTGGVNNGSMQTGIQTGNGQVTISW